jgi:PRTRC genetic system protein D
MNVAAVEIGYSKVMTNDKKKETVVFDTIVASGKKTDEQHGMLGTKDVSYITVNGNQKIVGPDAGSYTEATRKTMVFTDTFSQTDDYMALLLGALDRTNMDVIDILTLGLPYAWCASTKDSVIAKATGKHIVDNRTIHVKDVRVFDQPRAAMLAIFFDVMGKIPEARTGNTLLIDAGHYTVDYCVAEKAKIAEKKCGSERAGGARLVEEMSALAQEKCAKVFKTPRRVDHAMREFKEALDGENCLDTFPDGYMKVSDRSYRIGRQNFTYKDMCEILDVADETIKNAIEKIEEKVDLDDIDVVVCVGGGMAYYETAIRAFINNGDTNCSDINIHVAAKELRRSVVCEGLYHSAVTISRHQKRKS